MKFNSYSEYPYDIVDDIETIKAILDLSDEDLSVICGASIKDILSLDPYNPNKDIADKIYDYAYENGLHINQIKWYEFSDYATGDTKILSHGSRSGIKGTIRVDVSDEKADFGKGFYCGQSIEQAGMFVSNDKDSSIYILSFDGEGLKPIKFNVSTDWLLAVSFYRQTLGEYADSERVRKIIDKIEKADYVIAPIADNKMFETIDLFTKGEITDAQCKHALSATYLGNQYVFKTDKCVDHLDILNRCYICPLERKDYNVEADVETRTSLYKAKKAKYKFADKGQYIDELLR